jgi:hypothetical protein
MRLRKFIRDNSRTLLMIFMSLLLVAFLIPNAIQGRSQAEREYRRKLGRAFGRDITTQDLDQANSDIKIVSYAGLEQGLSQSVALPYYLMSQEAQRAGVRVGRDEVKAFLVERSQRDPVWQQPDETLKRIQQLTRRSYDQIYDAIGRWLAINRLGQFQASGLVDTLPRQELAYRNSTQEAGAQVVLIDDKAFVAQVPDPTEEELQSFFDECKGRKTAHTEKELVFGYLLPDRVQIQYLTVDPQQIKSQLTIPASQVRRFFEENAGRYLKPDPLASQPAGGGQVPQVPMTFEEARDRVRADYREARALELSQNLVNEMYHEARRPWTTSGRDAEGFAQTPPGDPVSFPDLREKFSTTYQVTYAQSGLVDADELRQLPDIGQAGEKLGTRQIMRVPELAFRVKGILEKDPADGKPVLNVNEPVVVLTYSVDPRTRDFAPRQAYLLRVSEVSPSAPPTEIGNLREKVVGDWKLLRAHELARQQAETLTANARRVGLPKAVEEATELKQILTEADQATTQPAEPNLPESKRYVQDLGPFTPQNRLTRSSTFLQSPTNAINNIPDIPPAIFDLADTPVDEAQPHRVGDFPIANQFRWLVAELLEVKPLYEGSFDKQLALQVQNGRLRYQVNEAFARLWASADNVEERTGFVPEATGQPAGGPPSEAP